jgi:adenylate cyclase
VTNNRLKNLLSSESAVRQRMLAMLILGSFGVLALLYGWGETRHLMEKRDRVVLDEFHVSSRKTPTRDDIIILGVDDDSQKLDTLWPEEIAASPALPNMKKAWPWPRRVWAQVLDRLFDAGASYVFLDLTFKAESHDPEDDRLLHEALKRHAGKVVVGGKWETGAAVGNQTAAASADNIPLMRPVATVLGPEEQAGDMFGLLNFFPDHNVDSVIRQAHYWISVNGLIKTGFVVGQPDPTEQPLPSIAMVLGRKIDPKAAARAGEVERIRFCAFNSVSPEVDAYPPFSIHQIFVPGLWTSNFADGAAFKGKTVMIGATASDLQDFQDTTLGRMEGVRVHAHALTALLAGSFVHAAPPWWPWASLALGTALAWALVSLIRHPLVILAALVMLIVGAYSGAFQLFDKYSLEASPVPFVLALGLCGVMGIAGNYLMQRRAQQRAVRFLARYTSKEQAVEMMRDRAGLLNTLGGTERIVTVLFSDVRGFTSMSETKSAPDLVAQLNEYLSKMVERVVDEKGIVDKFIGDAVMAVWGGMRSEQNIEGFHEDARRAVHSALQMRRALEELNADWRKRDMEELHFGIGIHQGTAVVGNIGSEKPYEKMDLTVLGDSVNTASRLEGLTKQYGVDFVVSGSVRQHLGDDFIIRSADLVRPKGKLIPLEVFAIIDSADKPKPAGLDDYETAIRLYREGKFPEALEKFMAAEAAGLGDHLTYEYIKRCDLLIKEPPFEWDGTYTAKDK